MAIETIQHFRYEIALGSPIPFPEPKLDYYPHDQFCVQQFLRALCKEKVGSLGKQGGKWAFGPDAPASVKLSSRPDIRQVFDFAEQLGIIVPDSASGDGAEGFVPYKLAESYWEKFDKFRS